MEPKFLAKHPSGDVIAKIRSPVKDIILMSLIHGGITLELCYNSGHISNPFSPSLFLTLGILYLLSYNVAKN